MVTVRDVSKCFTTSKGDNLAAIERISLDVSEGEFVSIIGHSGCGKTTLLKIVSGLISPSAGAVYVDGQEVRSPLRDVGMVFQHPLLMQWRTVMANVLLPIELLGRSTAMYQKQALELLKILGLSGFQELYPRELSGGMQQRVAIARALIHDPKILLLDEPFGSLDELTREEMQAELLKVTERMKKTVIFVTHSIPEAVMMGDRVILLSPRPSSTKMDITIRLPRPRDSSFRLDRSYLAYCEEIRGALGLAQVSTAAPV